MQRPFAPTPASTNSTLRTQGAYYCMPAIPVLFPSPVLCSTVSVRCCGCGLSAPNLRVRRDVTRSNSLSMTGNMRLHVAGVSSDISTKDLCAKFASLGDIIDCYRPEPRFLGDRPLHREYAFIELSDTDQSSVHKLISAVLPSSGCCASGLAPTRRKSHGCACSSTAAFGGVKSFEYQKQNLISRVGMPWKNRQRLNQLQQVKNSMRLRRNGMRQTGVSILSHRPACT